MIRKSIVVQRPIEEAFRAFTDGIGNWWPLKRGFSFGGERAAQIFLETRVGGRFFERFSDGEEFEVGKVTACTPPARIVFTWKQREWDGPTEVEVRFSAAGDATRVDLEHRGFEQASAEAEKSYNGGWDLVLACYAEGA